MPATTMEKPGTNDFYSSLIGKADEVEGEYCAQTQNSRDLFKRAGRVFPGGFTRDAILRSPYAPFIKSAHGTKMLDADDRVITDLWFNATSLPVGHSHPVVAEAAIKQVPLGTAYFAPTEQELALGELLVDRIPCAEKIRFTNSGSEAVMMAVRFARAHRNRTLLVKFEGSYHGSYDDVSWSVAPSLDDVGPESAPIPTADTSGLAGAEGRVVVLPYNDAAALRAYVTEHHDSIAAILVEPMANRMGLILPDLEFVREARELCDHFGVVLVFDEVIAFRVGYSGAHGELGVTPDLVTLGKIIGGGFPVGAVAGRADLLAQSDPSRNAGRVAHAGTFNGNPMVGAAGHATMSLMTRDMFRRIGEMGEFVRARLAHICEGLPLQVTGAGSLFKITATSNSIRNYRHAATANKKWEETASLSLLNRGFMLTPRLSGCVSGVTPKSELDAFLDAFKAIVES
jgi:glutamate-1-semialdehyde 2,1-aminomutase